MSVNLKKRYFCCLFLFFLRIFYNKVRNTTTIFEIAEPSKKSSYKFCFWCFPGEISQSKTGKYVYFKFLVLRTPQNTIKTQLKKKFLIFSPKLFFGNGRPPAGRLRATSSFERPAAGRPSQKKISSEKIEKAENKKKEVKNVKSVT